MSLKIMKSNKGKTNQKTGIIKLGEEIYVYIKTKGVENKELQLASNQLKAMYKLPKKQRPLTQEERKELGIETITAYALEFDTTSKEFQDMKSKIDSLQYFLGLVTLFDVSPLYENGATIWGDLNVEENNYIALAEYCMSPNGFCMSQEDLLVAVEEIVHLKKGEPTQAEIELTANDTTEAKPEELATEFVANLPEAVIEEIEPIEAIIGKKNAKSAK